MWYLCIIGIFSFCWKWHDRARAWSGHATVNQVRGNTIVWNQLVQNGNFVSKNGWTGQGGTTFTVDNNEATISFPALYAEIVTGVNLVNNHRYYLSFDCNVVSNVKVWIGCAESGANIGNRGVHVECNGIGSYAHSSIVGTFTGATENNNLVIVKLMTDSSNITATVKNVLCVDLTQMFGSTIANSMTAAQFEAMFPSDYYPYNSGQLISCGPTSVVSTGFNLWDEEWEVGGINQDGLDSDTSTVIRSVGYIEISPNVDYNFTSSKGTWYHWYDANKTHIESSYNSNAQFVVTSPNNAKYLRIQPLTAYGNIYKHDICINISDSAMNGTYKPYQTPDTLDMSWISELTYTPEGASEPVQMFPNGLCSAGTVYDEVTPTKAIKRVGSVDLGDMTFTFNTTSSSYNFFTTNYIDTAVAQTSGISHISSDLYTPVESNGAMSGVAENNMTLMYRNKLFYIRNDAYTDATMFKSAMSGHMVYYELGTPIEISLTKSMGYAVQPGGTEQLLPENQPGQTPLTSQIIIDVTYPLDSVGTLQNLKRNYMSEATLTSLITALNAINTNMSWKASRAADGSLIIAAN